MFAEGRQSVAMVLALAADHFVKDNAAFLAACYEGYDAMMAGRIVTFATEYGYISPGKRIIGDVREVARFVEKPDPVAASRYISDGFLWNSGNFMFQASALLDDYRKFESASVGAIADRSRVPAVIWALSRLPQMTSHVRRPFRSTMR